MSTSSDGGLRIVSIGFIRPEEDEMVRSRDTIYVCLRPWGSSIGAEAFSEEDFTYEQARISGWKRKEKTVISNMTHSRLEGLPIVRSNYETFIKELAKENDARVRYGLVEDGVILARRLEEIQGLAGIVQPR